MNLTVKEGVVLSLSFSFFGHVLENKINMCGIFFKGFKAKRVSYVFRPLNVKHVISNNVK